MRSTSRACARRAKSQTTKHIPVKSTMMIGGTPTASSIATIIMTAIAFVVSFPALVIIPPRVLLITQPRDNRRARFLRRELSAEISGGFIRRDRAAHSSLYLVTQSLEAQVF